MVIGIAHSAGPLETMKPTFNLMERLAEQLRTAAAPTFEDTGCACRKSNPNILVMQPAQDWKAKNTPCPLNRAR